MEQRIIIKFLAKSGKNSTETYEMLKKVYGDDSLSKRSVFDWHKQFRNGRETVEDEPRAGPSRTVRTPEMIQKVRDFIAKERNASVRMISDALGISTGSVQKIRRMDLNKKKVCATQFGRP